MQRTILTTLLVMMLCLVLIGRAVAVDTYWQAGTGNWGTGANWNNGEPTSSDTAYITNDGTAEITQAGETCYDLILNWDWASGDGNVSMTAGGLTADRHEYISWAGGYGTFTQSGGTNTVTSSLYIGYTNGADGEYTLSGTGQLWANDMYIGYTEATGDFIQTGGTCTINNNLNLGALIYGDGTYKLAGGTLNVGGDITRGPGDSTFIYDGGTLNLGGSISVDILYMGRAVGTSVVYTLSGTDVLSTKHEQLGLNGSVTFTQTGGNNTATSTIVMGGGNTGTGIYDLSGTGSLTVNGQMSVGYRGTGSTFTQSSGTNAIYGALVVGATWQATNATYVLNGGQVSTTGNAFIGHEGVGTFTQNGGTHTITNDLHVGRQMGISNGTYELNQGQLSASSEYIGYGAFYTAGPATGTFVQTGGTHIISDNLFLGYFSDGVGTYTISGGSLTVDEFFVGYNGSGTLNITDPAANITVSKLHFGPNSSFTAVPGAKIHFTPSAFENESTDPSALAGLSNLTLIFEGGSGGVDLFEVSGQDYGAVRDGLYTNFAVDTLTLGGVDIGQIQLVDNDDNQPGWVGNEKLYVRNLNIGPGSYLDLNSVDLYYINAAIDPTATIVGAEHLVQMPTVKILGVQNGVCHLTWSPAANYYLEFDIVPDFGFPVDAVAVDNTITEYYYDVGTAAQAFFRLTER